MWTALDAQRWTFHRCRAPDTRGQVFAIDHCSAGQVMDISSAVVGYSDRARLDANPPSCNWRNCTLSIFDAAFRSCNGLRSCSIGQDLLLRPGPGNSALCVLQTDANYIDVKFYCVVGRIKFFLTCYWPLPTMRYCLAYLLNTLT